MTGNVLTNDFYHNMLEAKCSVLKDYRIRKLVIGMNAYHISPIRLKPSAEPDGAHQLKLRRYSLS